MLKAIDVSVIQRNIDWSNVAERGIGAAMIKASQGRSEVDESVKFFEDGRFQKNMEGAVSEGIHCGVYHYLTAQTVAEAQKEAASFISVISKKASSVTLWAAVDVESKYLPSDKTLLTDIVLSFCDIVHGCGFKPCIYTNPSFLKYRLNDVSKYPLWLAYWRSNSPQWDAPQDLYAEQKAEQYPNAVMWQWGAYRSGIICGAECDGDYILKEPDGFRKTSKPETWMIGTKVKAEPDAVYTNGKKVPLWVRAIPLYVRGTNGNDVTVSILKTGAVTGTINRSHLIKW